MDTTEIRGCGSSHEQCRVVARETGPFIENRLPSSRAIAELSMGLADVRTADNFFPCAGDERAKELSSTDQNPQVT
jgi:hypothetical protein